MISREALDRVLEMSKDPKVYWRRCRENFEARWSWVSERTPYYEHVLVGDVDVYKEIMPKSTTFGEVDGEHVLMTVVEKPKYEAKRNSYPLR